MITEQELKEVYDLVICTIVGLEGYTAGLEQGNRHGCYTQAFFTDICNDLNTAAKLLKQEEESDFEQ